jgi:hypothetical protein
MHRRQHQGRLPIVPFFFGVIRRELQSIPEPNRLALLVAKLPLGCRHCTPRIPFPTGKAVALEMPRLAIRVHWLHATAKWGTGSGEGGLGKPQSSRPRPSVRPTEWIEHLSSFYSKQVRSCVAASCSVEVVPREFGIRNPGLMETADSLVAQFLQLAQAVPYDLQMVDIRRVRKKEHQSLRR